MNTPQNRTPDPLLAGAPIVAQPGAAPPKRPDSFPAMIEQLKKQVALALPRHLNADRMARIALTEFRKNPELAKCVPTSVFASVIIAAQLGLEPGVLGQGYLIPYNDRRAGVKLCQFVPGWQGLVDLAQRSGRSSVWTGAVFEGDEFEYAYGSSPYVEHVPQGADDPALLTHVYSCGWVKGAEKPIVDVWPIAKVWRHRERFNRVGTRHYSYEHPEMYARKIPLLQVLKYLPKCAELALGIDLENAANTSGQRLDISDAIEGQFAYQPPEDPAEPEHIAGAPEPASTTEKARALLRAKRGEPKAKAPPESNDAVAEPEPGRVPFYSQQSAIAALTACATLEALNVMWKELRQDFSGRDMPIEVEAVYHERREVLEQQSGTATPEHGT